MVTKRIKVYGIVQGVGMRPTVARHADSLGIKGSVANLGPYVEIYAQGEEQDVVRFIDLIRNEPPKRAAILKMDVKEKDGKNGYGKEYESNNRLIYEGEYLNGERNGKGKEYDKKGNLIFQGEFIDGKRWNGKFNGNNFNENGKITFEGE